MKKTKKGLFATNESQLSHHLNELLLLEPALRQQNLLSLSNSDALAEQMSRGNYTMSYDTRGDRSPTATTASISISTMAGKDQVQERLNDTDEEVPEHRAIDRLEVSAAERAFLRRKRKEAHESVDLEDSDCSFESGIEESQHQLDVQHLFENSAL